MEREKPKAVSDAREFFTRELKRVMEKQQVSAEGESFAYLVDLMVRYMESDQFFVKNADGKLENNVLFDLYAEYMQGDTQTKKSTLRRLGDVCLLVTGFFSDSLKRKVVDLDYYFGMGGSAYWQLSNFYWTGGPKQTFQELSKKFKPFSDVLGELSESGSLQTNSDLLRLYERWLMTGSERLRQVLSQQGIVAPVSVDKKVRH
jgi:hypothetical protein